MKCFLINEKLPSDLRAALSAYGEPIALPPFPALQDPVCRHPDMLVAKIERTLLVHAAYYEGRAVLDRMGIPYEVSYAPVGALYPQDIRLNCLAADTFFLSNEKHVSREALALAELRGLKRIHVSQGYAKCSCACAQNAIATMDRGIAKAVRRAGEEALLLEPSAIGIEIYDTGFIGGASVLLDERTLGFFGNVEGFERYPELKGFFEARDVRLVSLGKEPLFDYGGAISVEI